MDPNGRPRVGRLAQADHLFAASTYSEWVRETIRLREREPTTEPLFESTISEPLGDLVEIIRHAFSLSVSSRYASVFTGGNRFALAALARRYDVPVEQIHTTTGASSALDLLLRLLVQDGGEVLIENPGLDLLTQIARDAGADVVRFERPAPSFDIDVEILTRRITPRTRAIVLTNLHNPSGALASATTLLRIAEAAARVKAYVIVDEVYADFARPVVGSPAATLADNLVTISSLTKIFGLFALKFGWIVASQSLTDRLRARFPEGDLGVSKLSHAVAAHVLEEDTVFDLHWKRTLSETRTVAKRHWAAMQSAGLIEGEMPSFGPMAFPRIVGVDDTQAFARRLWIDEALLAAPGEFFGKPGHIRLGFGADPGRLDRNLTRLRAQLEAVRASR